jgi:hypothetical protein
MFKSKAQQAYLFAKLPGVAKEFAAATPKSAYKNLPLHAKQNTSKRKSLAQIARGK